MTNNNEYTYKVVEHFISINGEGRRAGQLAMFIRFAGCNLNCEYCDTKWANEKNVEYKEHTSEELVDIIQESGVKNITLTGGEPLIQEGIGYLLERLRKLEDIRVEIETNGSVNIKPYMKNEPDNVSFTLDYKTGASGMERKMCLDNYKNVRSQDTVKFVVGSIEDIEQTNRIINQYNLTKKGCGIYISPCFGKIEPEEIVKYLVEHRLNDVNVQLQLHKYIWDPDKRGV
ncbi:MAG: putative 7-carboxy-7-deazaguanine synthase QueE [Lachnospiraceae bacterium]|jgi:7-carboxy-7-deazaguanine synthase|nr:putative 7-carboxy-7-deazaguanine synthase QueE [Lachnospiraceae bacterium]